MEPEKASTRMKTKKTKMLISFKNTFCSQASERKFSLAEITFCYGKKTFCDFSVFMEPEKASTRMKTKKTKMLISFKNTFCSKNRQIKLKTLF